MTRRLLTLFALLPCLLLAPPALAIEDEWSIGAGPALASLPNHENGTIGLGASAFVRYAFTDALRGAVGLVVAHHLAAPAMDDHPDAPAFTLFIPRVGVVYAIDILDLIPYLTLDATAYFADAAFFPDADRTMAFGMAVGLGLDYRGWRAFSIGGEVAYHALLSDLAEYPAYLTFGLHATWHSDPF